jgi:hypothetical protein
MKVQNPKHPKVRIFKPKQKLQKSLPAFCREAFEFAGVRTWLSRLVLTSDI